MKTKRTRDLAVNLAVRDLKRSMAFFSKLGFEFNPKYTDDNAAGMIVNDQAFVMLLAEPFFRAFTDREICDTSRASEGLYAISCGDRAEVDALVEEAISAGGNPAGSTQDHSFMYGRGFYDLDGHHWEVYWMDEPS